MVSQTASSCYTNQPTGGDLLAGRRPPYNRPYPPGPYLGYQHDRRFQHTPPHDIRSLSTMAEQQHQQGADVDSPQQRKRIAVACGRCRKRKIRCSGDMGQGQPCQNCKNAGADQCLFLRVQSALTTPALPFPSPVMEGYFGGHNTEMESDSISVLQVQSREASFLAEPSGGHTGSVGGGSAAGDFAYSVGDARVLATRAPVAIPGAYPPDMPSNDVVGSQYRSGSAYPYATKPYYPAISSYQPHYGAEDFDYGMQPVIGSDVSMMPPAGWSSRKSSSTSYSSVYMDPSPPYSYGPTTSLVHRPAPSVTSDSAGPLSLTNFGAELPSATAPDRALPTPTRLPYPGTSGKTSSSASSSTGSGTLADVAAAASYVSSFEGSIPYSSASTSPTTHSDSHAHHGLPRSDYSSSVSRQEIFSSEQRHTLQSQGSGYDGLDGYTTREESGSGTLSNGHSYVPGEQLHQPVAHHTYSSSRVGHVGSVEGRVSVASRR